MENGLHDLLTNEMEDVVGRVKEWIDKELSLNRDDDQFQMAR